MNPDEIAPPPKPPKPVELETLSIVELELHITRLEAEIRRAREIIAAKRQVRGSADALFRKS